MNSTHVNKWLFACLYFSEGAPIGYLWLTLPTQMRSQEVPIQQITWLTAILVLPWTCKFLWAPLVDLLRGRRWTLRHWIVSSQIVMGLSLVPLLCLDPVQQFDWLAVALLIHAFSAATQDVAIDAYCISQTEVGQRGAYNAWMQVGMFLGRATMGGGALAASAFVGHQLVVATLIVLTTFSALLVVLATPSASSRASKIGCDGFLYSIRTALADRNTWIGMAFGAIGGASFKSLEVFYGPYLIDRGVSETSIGLFSVVCMSGLMVVGSLIGGRLSDRLGAKSASAVSLASVAICILLLGIIDYVGRLEVAWYAFPLLSLTALGIGIFTAASYSLYMDISQERLGATQFSAFMGSTNGCESWSSYASGLLIVSFGYYSAMCTMAVVSLAALPLLLFLRNWSGIEKTIPTTH